MAEHNPTFCNCPHCGAAMKPLLESSGTLARSLDPTVVGHDPVTDKPIRLSDIRQPPARESFQPRKLILPMILLLSVFVGTNGSIASLQGWMGNDLGGSGGGSTSYIAAMSSARDALIWVLSIFASIAFVIWVFRALQRARDNLRHAWLEQLANTIDPLRTLAGRTQVCEYCDTMQLPSAQSVAATPANVRTALHVPESQTTVKP